MTLVPRMPASAHGNMYSIVKGLHFSVGVVLAFVVDIAVLSSHLVLEHVHTRMVYMYHQVSALSCLNIYLLPFVHDVFATSVNVKSSDSTLRYQCCGIKVEYTFPFKNLYVSNT